MRPFDLGNRVDVLGKRVIAEGHKRSRPDSARSDFGLEVELLAQGQPMGHAQGEAHGGSIFRTVGENEVELAALDSAPWHRRIDRAWPLGPERRMNNQFHILV